MGQVSKSNGAAVEFSTEAKRKVFEYLQVNSRATLREIGNACDISHVHAWRIKAELLKLDLVEIGRIEARNLVPLALDAMEDCLKQPTKAETRRAASRDVLHGVQVLTDKKQVELTGDLLAASKWPAEMLAAIVRTVDGDPDAEGE